MNQKEVEVGIAESIYNTPLIDIKEREISPLQESDYIFIAQNISCIFQKVLYGLQRGLCHAVNLLLLLVEQCMEYHGSRIEQVLLQPSAFSTANSINECEASTTSSEGIQKLCEVLIKMLLSPKIRELHFQPIFLIRGIHTLLSHQVALKDPLGMVLPKIILQYLEKTFSSLEISSDNYEVPRYCASILIELLHGSYPNKNRISLLATKPLSFCLTSPSCGDFYFQMQCIEILFRLHLHNPTLFLSQISAPPGLPSLLVDGITLLRNDTLLLSEMKKLLHKYHYSAHHGTSSASSSIHHVDVVHLMAGEAEVKGHADMYFSRYLLVIMLPGTDGGNHFCIPYEHIRSVKISRDYHLGIRLNVIPEKLSLLMSVEQSTPVQADRAPSPATDLLQALLTPAGLQYLRESGVQQWIIERKNQMRSITQQELPYIRTENAPNSSPVVDTADSLSKYTSGSSLSTLPPNCHPLSGVSKGPLQNSSSCEVSDSIATHSTSPPSVLKEVEDASRRKHARYRQERDEHLQQVRDRVEEELRLLHRQHHSERERFEKVMEEDWKAIQQVEASMKKSASDSISALNKELIDVQALGNLLIGEADQVRSQLGDVVNRLENGVEVPRLVEIKEVVEEEIRALQEALRSIVTETGPYHVIRAAQDTAAP